MKILKWIPPLHTAWFYKFWWIMLLEKPFSIRKFWCRACNHPSGVIWYTTTKWEPDMRCKNCGDDLG